MFEEVEILRQTVINGYVLTPMVTKFHDKSQITCECIYVILFVINTSIIIKIDIF